MGEDEVGQYSLAAGIRHWPAGFKCTRPAAPGLFSLAGEVLAEESFRQSRPDRFESSLIAQIIVIGLAVMVLLYVLKTMLVWFSGRSRKPKNRQETRGPHRFG